MTGHTKEKWAELLAEAWYSGLACDSNGVNISFKDADIVELWDDVNDDVLEYLDFLDDIAVEIAGSKEKAKQYESIINKHFLSILKRIFDAIATAAKKAGLNVEHDEYSVCASIDAVKLPEDVVNKLHSASVSNLAELRELFSSLLTVDIVKKLNEAYAKILPVAKAIDECIFNEKTWRLKYLSIPTLMKIKEEILTREIYMIYPTKMKRLKSGSYRLYIPSKIIEIALNRETVNDDEIYVRLKVENGDIRIILLSI